MATTASHNRADNINAAYSPLLQLMTRLEQSATKLFDVHEQLTAQQDQVIKVGISQQAALHDIAPGLQLESQQKLT